MSGTFSFSALLFLTSKQRIKLERLARDHGGDVSAVVSAILAEQLDALPGVQLPPAEDRAEALRTRRAELARLVAKQAASGSAAPGWLIGYIAELRAEIARLEQ